MARLMGACIAQGLHALHRTSDHSTTVSATLPGPASARTALPPLKTRLNALLPLAGTAYSFFTASNGRMAKQLVQILEEAAQPVPPELRQYAMTSGGPTSECTASLMLRRTLLGAVSAMLIRVACKAVLLHLLILPAFTHPIGGIALQASALAAEGAAAVVAAAAAAALAPAATLGPMRGPLGAGVAAAAAAAITEHLSWLPHLQPVGMLAPLPLLHLPAVFLRFFRLFNYHRVHRHPG